MSSSDSEHNVTTSTESDDDDDDDVTEETSEADEASSSDNSFAASTNFQCVLNNRKKSNASEQVRRCISTELLQFLTIKNSIPKLQGLGTNSSKFTKTFNEALADMEKKEEMKEPPSKESVDWNKLISILTETRNVNLFNDILAEMQRNYGRGGAVPFKDMPNNEKIFADLLSHLLRSHLPEKQFNEPTDRVPTNFYQNPVHATPDQRYNLIPDLANLFELLMTTRPFFSLPPNLRGDVKNYQNILTDPNNNDYNQMNHNMWSNENCDADPFKAETARPFENSFHQLNSFDCLDGLSDTRLLENGHDNFEFVSNTVTTSEHVLKCPYDVKDPSANTSNSQATGNHLVHNMSDDYPHNPFRNGICCSIPPTLQVYQPSIFNCQPSDTTCNFINKEVTSNVENSYATPTADNFPDKKSCKNLQSFESTNLTFSDIFQNIQSLSRILSSHRNENNMMPEAFTQTDMIVDENSNPIHHDILLNNHLSTNLHKTNEPIKFCDRSTTMSFGDKTKVGKNDSEQIPLKSSKRLSKTTNVNFHDSTSDKCLQVSHENHMADLKKANESSKSVQETLKLNIASEDKSLSRKTLVSQSVQADVDANLKNQQTSSLPASSNTIEKCMKNPNSVIITKCFETNKLSDNQTAHEMSAKEEKQFKDTACNYDDHDFLEASSMKKNAKTKCIKVENDDDMNKSYKTTVSRHLISSDDLNNSFFIWDPKKEKSNTFSSAEIAPSLQLCDAINETHCHGINKIQRHKHKTRRQRYPHDRKRMDSTLDKINNLNNCLSQVNSEKDYQSSKDTLQADRYLPLAKIITEREKADNSYSKFPCGFSNIIKKCSITDITDSFDTIDACCNENSSFDIMHCSLPRKKNIRHTAGTLNSKEIRNQNRSLSPFYLPDRSDLLIKAALAPADVKQHKTNCEVNFKENLLNNPDSLYAKLIRKDSIMGSFIDKNAKLFPSNNVTSQVAEKAEKTEKICSYLDKNSLINVVTSKNRKNKDFHLFPKQHSCQKHTLNEIRQAPATFCDLDKKNETRSNQLNPPLKQTDSEISLDKSSYFPITKALKKFSNSLCKEAHVDSFTVKCGSDFELEKTEHNHQDNYCSHSSPLGELHTESLKSFLEFCNKNKLQKQKRIEQEISTSSEAKAVSPVRLVKMTKHPNVQLNPILKYNQFKNKNKSCKNNVKISILESTLDALHLNSKNNGQGFRNTNTNNANNNDESKTNKTSSSNDFNITRESGRPVPLYKPLKSTCHLDEEDVWNGETMLMRAVLNRSYQTVENLLWAGCTIDQIDFKGRTAFFISMHLPDSNSAQMLLKHGSVVRDYKILQIAFARSSQISEFIKILLMVIHSGINLSKNINWWDDLITRVIDKCLEQYGSNDQGLAYVSRLNCIKQSNHNPQSLQTKCILAIRGHLLKLNRGRSILGLLSCLQLPRHFIDLLAFNGLSL